MSGTSVTALDLETGEHETQTITDDWVVITDGKYYVDGVVSYKNGTAVITVKVKKTEPNHTSHN